MPHTAFRAAVDRLIGNANELLNTFDCVGHRRVMSDPEVAMLEKIREFRDYDRTRTAFEVSLSLAEDDK